MFKKSAKRASITSEVSFTILATLAILFLALGMFQDNIKQFIDKGGFPSVWNANAVKTAQENWNIDPTKRAIITTPEIQTTSWDAILQGLNNKAKKKIETYYAIYIANGSNENSLTEVQKVELAKWLAIFANSSKQYSGVYALTGTYLENTDYSYAQFGYDQKIDVYGIKNYNVTTNKGEESEKVYSWDTSPYAYEGTVYYQDAKIRVTNIREGITPAFSK